jgi:hypothetical protein
MNLEDILNQLKSERSRLNQAISALEGRVSGPIRRRGRPPEERAYERSAEAHAECRSSSTYSSSNESSVGGAQAWI